jgi:hypothetical protein
MVEDGNVGNLDKVFERGLILHGKRKISLSIWFQFTSGLFRTFQIHDDRKNGKLQPGLL